MDNKAEDRKYAGLYIHIPFCIKKCAYCDFASYEDYSLQEAYFSALKNEVDMITDEWKSVAFDTLFFGGGTPSSVEDIYLDSLMEHIAKKLNLNIKEATIEANPGTVDEHKLKFYLYMGINRISFGMQSAQDHILKHAGRIHTFSEAKDSIKLAERSGFSNINVDIMSGLPHQKAEDLAESVRSAADMGVPHISMYTLKLEEGTPLHTAVNEKKIILPDKDYEFDMSKAARLELSKMGYNRYEISNYSKPGYECRHNLHYWHNDDFLGLGLAAASAKGGMRITNTRDINEYINLINEGALPFYEKAQSSDEEYAFETLMLGLRLAEGVKLMEYKARHSVDLLERMGSEITSLMERGLADIYEGRLYLTEEGMDIQNTVLVEMMERFDF